MPGTTGRRYSETAPAAITYSVPEARYDEFFYPPPDEIALGIRYYAPKRSLPGTMAVSVHRSVPAVS